MRIDSAHVHNGGSGMSDAGIDQPRRVRWQVRGVLLTVWRVETENNRSGYFVSQVINQSRRV